MLRDTPMHIVSWNARQKFRDKISLFSPDTIDVLVVQECENTKVAEESYLSSGWKHIWVGDNQHKGLGVFVPINASIKKLGWRIREGRYFLPVRIKHDLVVVAVWAMGGKSKSNSYAGHNYRGL